MELEPSDEFVKPQESVQRSLQADQSLCPFVPSPLKVQPRQPVVTLPTLMLCLSTQPPKPRLPDVPLPTHPSRLLDAPLVSLLLCNRDVAGS